MCVLFDVHDLAAITELSKSNGQAITSSAAGTSDAMGIVLGFHGQTKVEHVGDSGHIDAACGYVGSHQNLHLAAT